MVNIGIVPSIFHLIWRNKIFLPLTLTPKTTFVHLKKSLKISRLNPFCPPSCFIKQKSKTLHSPLQFQQSMIQTGAMASFFVKWCPGEGRILLSLFCGALSLYLKGNELQQDDRARQQSLFALQIYYGLQSVLWAWSHYKPRKTLKQTFFLFFLSNEIIYNFMIVFQTIQPQFFPLMEFYPPDPFHPTFSNIQNIQRQGTGLFKYKLLTTVGSTLLGHY